MAKTKYIANTHIALTVKTEKGTKHVSFKPVTGGKSVYYTEDEALKKAIEGHYRYGHLFRRDVNFEKQREAAKKKEQPRKEDPKKNRTVTYTTFTAAKEDIAQKMGENRTDMKTVADVVRLARKHGIDAIILDEKK